LTSNSNRRVWLFDLDNTLHDASHASFGGINQAMTDYVAQHLNIEAAQASHLRQHYWQRYGATVLGLMRHCGVDARHFLEHTHVLPGLEDRLRTSAHDRAALKRLPGRKFVLTNAPRGYAMRVLRTLKLLNCFEDVICIDDMWMCGQLRPKPDARMYRRLLAQLKIQASRCVLVEDALENQKTAHALGIKTVWMRRYIDGRYRGHLRLGADAGAHNDPPFEGGVRVHPCPSRGYVRAKIGSIKKLLPLSSCAPPKNQPSTSF
jgi:putative hydrolase of the HAD superfamily